MNRRELIETGLAAVVGVPVVAKMGQAIESGPSFSRSSLSIGDKCGCLAVPGEQPFTDTREGYIVRYSLLPGLEALVILRPGDKLDLSGFTEVQKRQFRLQLPKEMIKD